MIISEQAKTLCAEKLADFFDKCDVVAGALVSTLDGQLLASRQTSDDPLARVAVMGGSLISLTDTMIAELNLGHNENVISQNKEGILIFMHITSQLVLVSFTRNTQALGLLLAHTKVCANALSDLNV